MTVTFEAKSRIIKHLKSKDKDNSFFASDKALWLRLKKFKDKEAFLKAYDAYAEDIYRFLYYKVGNQDEAKDLASATFVKAWSVVREGKLKDEEDYKTLRAFLYRIARNQAIDYYRQKKAVNMSELANDKGESPDWQDESQDPQALDNAIDAELVLMKLKRLKSEYQNVLVLYYINELSVAEIAQILDKSKGNVRVLIYRALAALRGLMEE